MTPRAAVRLRVLYLFAGVARRADIGDYLRKLVEEFNVVQGCNAIVLDLVEVDTLRGGLDHNLLNVDRQQQVLEEIAGDEFDVVIIAPPCVGFSRVLFANRAGPPPLRDAEWPK